MMRKVWCNKENVPYCFQGHPSSCLVMPLHVLWTHNIRCKHTVEFRPTSPQQTKQGYLPDFWKTSWPSPETRDMVSMLIRIPLLSMPAFHALRVKIHSLGCPRWAPGRQHRGAPMVYQSGTRAIAPPVRHYEVHYLNMKCFKQIIPDSRQTIPTRDFRVRYFHYSGGVISDIHYSFCCFSCKVLLEKLRDK